MMTKSASRHQDISGLGIEQSFAPIILWHRRVFIFAFVFKMKILPRCLLQIAAVRTWIIVRSVAALKHGPVNTF